MTVNAKASSQSCCREKNLSGLVAGLDRYSSFVIELLELSMSSYLKSTYEFLCTRCQFSFKD